MMMEQMKRGLEEADHEEHPWRAPLDLQHWLQLTYERERIASVKKQSAAREQFDQAREMVRASICVFTNSEFEYSCSIALLSVFFGSSSKTHVGWRFRNIKEVGSATFFLSVWEAEPPAPQSDGYHGLSSWEDGQCGSGHQPGQVGGYKQFLQNIHSLCL